MSRSFRAGPARRARVLAAGTAAVALAACSADRLNVPNENSPGTDAATRDARSAVSFLANGILDQARAQQPGHVSGVGIMGRESFNYTPQESRNTTGYLVDPENPTSFSAGVSWGGRYTNLRNVSNLRTIVENATVLNATEKAGTLGFARTMGALELHYVAATRDQLGAPVELGADASTLSPFVSRDSVYRFIEAELNAARTDLAAGGSSFLFPLTAGFTGFNTPTTFTQFNRALAARVYVYHATAGCGTACYTQALTALGESFIDPAGDLARGVYHVYSTGSGEARNTINAATNQDVVAHPSIKDFAASGDARYTAKIRTVTQRGPGGSTPGIATDVAFSVYPAQTTPIAIIRNEELILLRAEARYFTGDQSGALADINTIRTRSGGLAARGAFTSDADFVTELLTQRRLSLLFEGHRWFDMRRLGRLADLPIDVPQHKVVANFVIPQGECQVRSNSGNQALLGPGCP